METAEDTRSKPIAIPSDFRSGLANAIIFRNEDTFCESLLAKENKRDHNGGRKGGGDGGRVLYALARPGDLDRDVKREEL
jgi:hypothetical protein